MFLNGVVVELLSGIWLWLCDSMDCSLPGFSLHGISNNWLVWSLCSPRDSQEYFATPQFKSIKSLALSFLYGPTLISIHDVMDHGKSHIGKAVALTGWTFVGKVMSLLFNILSRLVITFLPRHKCLLISWLQSPSAVIFGAQENKVCQSFYCYPIYLP